MRLRFLTATLALFASITVLFTGFAAPQAGAAPTTAAVAAIEPDHVPDYCLTSNPPPICWAFNGSAGRATVIDLVDFSDVLIDRGGIFRIPDDSFNHPCMKSNPPRWCWLVAVDHSDIIDPDPTIYVTTDRLREAVVQERIGGALINGGAFDTLVNQQVARGLLG